MKLHLLALPHTVTRADFSHCAFTGKVLRFSPMLRKQGYEVIHYGVEGSESGANEHVEILTRDEHLQLLGIPDYHVRPRRTVGSDALEDGPVYRQFNFTLRDELQQRLEPGDVVCLPFGNAHDAATRGLELLVSGEAMRLETGIGYPDPPTMHRVYESEAWRHWVLGAEQRSGAGWKSPRLEWVIPNYYDPRDWPFVRDADLSAEAKRTVVFFGRVCEAKGAELVPVLARARPDLHFVMCGQGEPEPYLTEPNIEFREPIRGDGRAEYLGNAAVAIFPSRFVEPFCGAAVETMLCGTPVLTSDFGAFTETNIPGVTGYRCGGEQSWLDALDRAMQLDRLTVRMSAAQRFAMDVCGPQYARVLDLCAGVMRNSRPQVAA